MESTEILFTPMRIGNVEIKNRFIMCPMEGTSTDYNLSAPPTCGCLSTSATG